MKPKAPKKQCMSVVYAMELVKENLIAMTSKIATYKGNKERTRGLRRVNKTYHKVKINKVSSEVWEKTISRHSRQGNIGVETREVYAKIYKYKHV